MPTASVVNTVDMFTLAQAQRVAAMLGVELGWLTPGDPVPRGWHFALIAGQTPRKLLRSDGFPGLGVAMPEMGRPRLLLGQRSTTFHADLQIGAPIRRQSTIASIVDKIGRNGPLSIVKVEHNLIQEANLPTEIGSIVEAQTYFLASLPPPSEAAAEAAPKTAAVEMPTNGLRKVVTPDDLMLFQYSALGFNTHRIHFDRDYAMRVERHPDLVVNGGLATLLATEFLRVDLGRKLKTLTARHLAPLYVNRPLTIFAPELSDAQARMLLIDCDGVVAAELVITFDEL